MIFLAGEHLGRQEEPKCEHLSEAVPHGAQRDCSTYPRRPMREVRSREAKKLTEVTTFTRRG